MLKGITDTVEFKVLIADGSASDSDVDGGKINLRLPRTGVQISQKP